jgi:hypothetical protein
MVSLANKVMGTRQIGRFHWSYKRVKDRNNPITVLLVRDQYFVSFDTSKNARWNPRNEFKGPYDFLSQWHQFPAYVAWVGEHISAGPVFLHKCQKSLTSFDAKWRLLFVKCRFCSHDSRSRVKGAIWRKKYSNWRQMTFSKFDIYIEKQVLRPQHLLAFPQCLLGHMRHIVWCVL